MLTAPYLPLGKISILQGDPGVGKTTVALNIAAALTRGEALPWEAIPFGACDIIFQSLEDRYGDTIRPRLEQFGADCDRVHVINEDNYPLTLGDSRLEQAIVKTGAKLLILDPLSQYMGAEMCGAGVRPIMTRLSEMAKRTNCAILLISHLNKKGGKSQYRGLGAIDISAVARSVLTVGKLSLDESMRAFVHSKSNLAPCGEPQAFGFDEVSAGPSCASFTWLGTCDITLDELLDGKTQKSGDDMTALDTAMSFLQTELSGGALPSTQIIRNANAKGISERTLKRAKQQLGVRLVKTTGGWLWSLPDIVVYETYDEPQSQECQAQPCQSESLALLNVV
jgi:KaiC/GvpD/RAD55 family RecA-like ATPase